MLLFYHLLSLYTKIWEMYIFQSYFLIIYGGIFYKEKDGKSSGTVTEQYSRTPEDEVFYMQNEAATLTGTI